jgi:hypothetical protein
MNCMRFSLKENRTRGPCQQREVGNPGTLCKKIKLQPPDFEWVAQVSLLRPGFLLRNRSYRTPRSQKRELGHPLNIRPRHFHLFIFSAGPIDTPVGMSAKDGALV